MMQSGLSRQLFEAWCTDKRNGVLIAGYCVEGTLAKVRRERGREGREEEKGRREGVGRERDRRISPSTSLLFAVVISYLTSIISACDDGAI
jgi:Cft2 family RNA processing exonuclease